MVERFCGILHCYLSRVGGSSYGMVHLQGFPMSSSFLGGIRGGGVSSAVDSSVQGSRFSVLFYAIPILSLGYSAFFSDCPFLSPITSLTVGRGL